MSIDDATALGIARSRGVGVIPLKDGSWGVITSKGERVESSSYPSPNDALASADTILAQVDTRVAESRFPRLRQALEAAIYVPWPRLKADGTTEWLVMRVSDRQPMSSFSGLMGCLIEIARLVNVPI